MKTAIILFAIVVIGAAIFLVSRKHQTSEFYVHHTGFGVIYVNYFAQGEPALNMVTALVESPDPKKFRDIRAGKNAIYIEFTVPDDATEDKFICLAFVHHDVPNRKRLDLFISPGADPDHIHVRLTSNRDKVIHDGDVAFKQATEEAPFVLDQPTAS